ncbi:MAG: hypothetical protein U1D66_14265 [Erythrobacter sp.]|nr:hypothetical protein [Erythrobacter sp.]
MDPDFDFYMMQVDAQPASIFVNLALAQVAPIGAVRQTLTCLRLRSFVA